MNILVTGANGQLGNEMRVVSKTRSEHEWFFTDVQELDITDREAIRTFMKQHKINAVVNCAAYTNVDKAEADEQTAYLINALAAENLAVVATEVKALLVHISTDYVFDGNASVPYKESDTPDPKTAYGRTKLAGEQLILAACPDAFIIRTAWLYSSFGNNFVKTMLRLGVERDTISVVNDQIGTPTYAADLAKTIMIILTVTTHLPSVSANHLAASFPRIYHFTNEGVCSWYDFTREIHRLTGIQCQVLPITSDQYPQKTPRPHFSVLDKHKISEDFGILIPQWQDSLAECLKILNVENRTI